MERSGAVERVRDVEMHVVKLGKLLGIEADGGKVRLHASDHVGCVTEDLEVDALTVAMLESMRELDLMLVSLLEVEKPPATKLRQEIATLKKTLSANQSLLTRSRSFLTSTHA
eukprot:CAMPEP_0198323864 /NCGR_PEP_ID=MMETSP1450-20131203/11992_1 /TAXON_ID=753684 ORGANISM="Madagascaria erythrocladiodes, Strain CCMP3234" /NCGR_SAMPLE_ID=MMETSP1450 /ASSEMBLY_ACC=CAM_ASM_001115 /LENGTH=112 /DNA_ID=CAMNT_0044027607 /DNA_START=21 /DNA_END=356 /DNA_ORIENTATION=-